MPKVGRERKSINKSLNTVTKRTQKRTQNSAEKRSLTGIKKISLPDIERIVPKYWIEPISELSVGSKAIYRLVSTKNLRDWAKDYGFPFSDNPEDYIVFRFKDDFDHDFDYNDVYNELSLHYKLSVNGFMPKIVWCFTKGPINPNVYSFSDFMKSVVEKINKIPKDMKYIVEKVMCGNDLLATYEENYSQYFSDIKGLFHRLAVEEGIMLLDMKPEHLCKNKQGELCFIDADAYFVENIGKTEIDNAVTYMMFQIYAMLNANNFEIDIKDTGITNVEYTNMMKYIVGLQIKNDCSKDVPKHTPLEMLIRYSKRDSDSSTDIMSEIKAFYAPSLFHNFCRNYAPVLEPVFYHIHDRFTPFRIEDAKYATH
jgi:hypothetical protein